MRLVSWAGGGCRASLQHVCSLFLLITFAHVKACRLSWLFLLLLSMLLLSRKAATWGTTAVHMVRPNYPKPLTMLAPTLYLVADFGILQHAWA
jgi:hypothetical protein